MNAFTQFTTLGYNPANLMLQDYFKLITDEILTYLVQEFFKFSVVLKCITQGSRSRFPFHIFIGSVM